MRQESKDMASLISGLTDKVKKLPETQSCDASQDDTLGDIRTLLSDLNEKVKTVSETLARLSEEA